MEISTKELPAQLLLSITTKLSSFAEIPAFAQKQMPQLYAKAKALGAQISGPEVFIYHFEPDCSMQLRIGIPLHEKKAEAGEFEYHTTATVKCACAIHNGSMKTIGASWDALTHEMKNLEQEFTNECREVYLVWKDFDSAENVTELQRVLK